MVLSSCGGGEPTNTASLDKAIKADYSNSKVSISIKDASGEKSLSIINKDGFGIVEMNSETFYYHSFNNEGYKYYDDDYGNGAAWIKEAQNNKKVSLKDEYFDVASLGSLVANEFTLDENFYNLASTSLESVATLLFKGNMLASSESVNHLKLELSEDYIKTVTAYFTKDESEYFSIALSDIGSANYEESLPAAPSNENIKTWEDFSKDNGGDEPDPEKTLAEALKSDYSNSTIIGEVEDGDLSAYFTETNYDGYSIIYDGVTAGEEQAPLFYHDYENESYLYFEDNYGHGDAWLKNGRGDAPLGIENTYFNYDALAEIDVSTAQYQSGLYFIVDLESINAIVEKLFSSVALVNSNDVTGLSFKVTGDYVTSINAICDDYGTYYSRLTLNSFGETTYPDDSLPTAPNAQNVKTWYEYSGETPVVDVPVTSLSIAPLSGQPTTLEIEGTTELVSTISPADATDKTLSWKSSNEEVATVDFSFTQGNAIVTAVAAGTAKIYVEHTNKDNSVIKSNEITITVNAVQVETISGDKVYDLSFDSITGENEKQEVVLHNAVNNGLPVVATGENLKLSDSNYGDHSFDPNIELLTFDPSQINKNPNVIEFNFDDQQVSGIAFYYGLLFANQESNVKWLSKAVIETKGDEENAERTVVYDFLEVIKSKISGENLNLLQKEFAPTSHLRITIDCSNLGNPISFSTNAFRLYANDKCHDHVEEVVKTLTGVTLADEKTVKVGSSVNMVTTLAPLDATKVTLAYSSKDTAIATVTNEGVVTGVKEGSVEIKVTATQGKIVKEDTTTVVVEKADVVLTGITVEESVTMETNSTHKIEVATVPADAKDVTWTYSSGNTAIATCTTGTITTYGTKGSTTITVTATQKGGATFTKTVNLTVNETLPATMPTQLAGTYTSSYYAGSSDVEVKIGADGSLTLDFNGEKYSLTYDHALTKSSFEFATSDKKTLTVEQVVEYQYIWVESEDLSITPDRMDMDEPLERVAEVAATSIDIKEADFSLKVGEKSKALTVTFTPSGTTDTTVTWKSSNTGIATVDAKGVVSAIKEGEATITATSSNGKTATVKVTVEAKSTSTTIPEEFVGTWYAEYVVDFVDPLTLIIKSDGSGELIAPNSMSLQLNSKIAFKSFANGVLTFEDSSGYEITFTIKEDGTGSLEYTDQDISSENYGYYFDKQ